MSEQIKDGGPAFPVTETTVHMSGDGESGYTPVSDVHSFGGMTLRDYFAAKAMQAAVSTGELPSDWLGFNENGDWLGLASHAYAIANAMLAAREAKS